MAVYASFLVYQFKTHSSLFKQESEKVPSSFRLSPSKDAIATGISRVGAEPALLRGSVSGTSSLLIIDHLDIGTMYSNLLLPTYLPTYLGN